MPVRLFWSRKHMTVAIRMSAASAQALISIAIDWSSGRRRMVVNARLQCDQRYLFGALAAKHLPSSRVENFSDQLCDDERNLLSDQIRRGIND
jgi:hypothetical protein